MTLEKLQSEMIAAMKSGSKVRKLVISGLIDNVKKAAIDKNCRDNITETLVDEALLKCKKIAQEMVDTCPADRTETLAEYTKQLEIINEFAPMLISDEAQIKTIILDFANENNIELTKSNRGKIIGIIAKSMKGQVDMKIVNKVIGEIVS